VKRTHERRGKGADWKLPVSSTTLFALFAGACAAPAADDSIEVIPPRVDPVGLETSTPAPEGAQAAVPEIDEGEQMRWHAMWLLAGEMLPPDLSAALVSVRKDRVDIALDLIRELLEGPESGAFRGELADILTRRDTDPLLWCAAARASARLSLHEITNSVAMNLDSPSAARRVAAREALFDLRGSWFSSAAEVEVHIGEGSRLSATQLATMHAMTDRLQEHATALYALDPAWAEAGLDDSDPELRVAAARALAEALALADPPAGFDPDRARSALFERLGQEEHPLVLYVLIEGLLEHLGPADTCTSDGRKFAGALHARVEGCDATMLAPLVHGLARMPLDPALRARGEDGVPDACSFAYAAEALIGEPDDSGAGGLLIEWMRPRRLVDRDALASALRSIETFFERFLLDDTPRPELREALLEAIEDPLRDASIGAGAVRVLARAGRPEDLPRLGAALTEAPTGIAYELIATITQLVEGVETTTEPSIAARDALVAMLYRDEASLRRRALAMLATEPLAGLAETIDAGLLLVVLEQDLPAEDSETILGLLARRKDPSLVDALLSSSAFDRLVAPTSGTASILTDTLGELAAGDGPLTHHVARQLIGTAGSEGVQHLRNALALLAALPESAARNLGPDQHADVVRWSIELREAAGTLAGVTAEEPPIAFLERLTGLHLVDRDPTSDEEPWAHHMALLYADLFAALESDLSEAERERIKSEMRPIFHRAQEHAISSEDELDEVIVYRDFARFLFSADDLTQALLYYRSVVREEAAHAVPVESTILDLADLRRAAICADAGAAADPESVPTALDFTLALVGRKYWKSEPAGVRLGDLRSLVARAGDTQAGRAALFEVLRFTDLPAPDIDLADAVLPADAPWLGLETDPEQLVELRKLAVELETLPQAPGEPDPADPAEEAKTSEEALETASEEEPESGA